jgi:hypothetical protein
MISLHEAQELHELIGVALEDARNGETGDVAELERAHELVAVVVSDALNVEPEKAT